MRFTKHIAPIVSIVLIIVLLSQVLYTKIMDRLEQRTWEELEITAQSECAEFETKMKDEITKLHLVKSCMMMDDVFDAESLASLHIPEIQPTTVFSRIDIMFPNNRVVSNGQINTVQNQVRFEELANKGEYMSTRQTDFLTGESCVYYVLPVMRNDNAAAVLIGVIDPKKVSEFFKPALFGGQVNICIIDAQDGNYIADNWHKELINAFQTPDRKRLPGYEHVDLKSDIKKQKTGTVAFVSQTTGKGLYMYYTPMQLFQWQFAVFVQEEVLFANVISMRKYFVIAGVIEGVLLLAYFVWNILFIRRLEWLNKEILQQKKQLEYLSYTDIMTGLCNRHKFAETLQFFQQNKPTNVGAAYIDLNGLKQINDSFSHDAGDQYIQKTAKVIFDVFGSCGYRIGGDEFLVLCTDMQKDAFVQKIQELFDKMKNEEISVSIGTKWSREPDCLTKLFREAEKRMYADKKQHYETDIGKTVLSRR